MFYKKQTNFPKTKSLEIGLEDFSKGLNFSKEENILNTDYSVNNYNFAYKKGVLTENYGFETLTCPNYMNDDFAEVYFGYDYVVNFKTLWFFKVYDEENGGRVDKLCYYADDKGLYYSRVMTRAPIIARAYQLEYEEQPTFFYNIKLNNVDYNLFGSENMGVYKFDGAVAPVLMPNFPNLSSMCEDKGKLFGTTYGEKNIVYYHTDLDFTTWTKESDESNGKIVMNDDRGKINKVIPFLGYVFAIRDYGITKIINYANKVNFDITHLSLSGNKIYENTVQICSDKMIMLTRDGISSFNGVTSKILPIEINELLKGVNNDKAVSVYHSGKYYLACKLNFKDENKIGCESLGFTNNAIIVLDPETFDYDIIRGVDVANMVSIKLNKMDKIALVLNSLETTKIIGFNNSGSFYLTPLKKEWSSGLTDLGYSNKIKLIKEFSLLSLYDCEVTIFTENKTKQFNIKGGNALKKFKVNLKGNRIGFKINSNTSKAYVSNLKLKIDLLDYGFNK